MHHTARDEETTEVSLFKIQSNSASQDDGMTFGAVKAVKRFKELRVCSVKPAAVTEMETSIQWANKQW